MARESSKIGQKPEAEQSRAEDVRKKCSMPREKCAAKRRIQERIV